MTSQTQGIQQLLAAEKKAAEKVAEARKRKCFLFVLHLRWCVMWPKKSIFSRKTTGKARRLKQAKDEATEEIEKYRQEREKQFKEFEAKVNILIVCLRSEQWQ